MQKRHNRRYPEQNTETASNRDSDRKREKKENEAKEPEELYDTVRSRLTAGYITASADQAFSSTGNAADQLIDRTSQRPDMDGDRAVHIK